jgi:NAD(P)-dependent dehydrogenase (short-subunit alcohol dehydrogenase family)
MARLNDNFTIDRVSSTGAVRCKDVRVGDTRWTELDMPDQTGRVALVTGANSGIGFETALALAAEGATVLLGCRQSSRAVVAAARIRDVVGDADVCALAIDLADLSSVRAAAEVVLDSVDRLDLLINNAGVMAVPQQQTTDGFEMQFGTNHLGHFALTGLMLQLLAATPLSRVVTVSSQAHRIGRIDFDDLDGARRYRRWLRYGQSKAANLLFTYELQRRLAAGGIETIAVAAHPGASTTALGRDAGPMMKLFQPLADRVTQPAAMGALPTLRAATDPSVRGGEYYGPDGPGQTAGLPVRVHSNAYTHRADVATHLWLASEELTGISYLD